MRCSAGLLMSMQSKSYDSPAGLPFLAGHVLWTSLNTVSCIIILLPFVFCFSAWFRVPVRGRTRTGNHIEDGLHLRRLRVLWPDGPCLGKNSFRRLLLVSAGSHDGENCRLEGRGKFGPRRGD